MQKSNEIYKKTRLGRAIIASEVKIRIIVLVTGLPKSTLYRYLRGEDVTVITGVKYFALQLALEHMVRKKLYPNGPHCSDDLLLTEYTKELDKCRIKFATELALAES